MTEEVLSVEKAGRGRALITLPSGRFIVPAVKAPGRGSHADPSRLAELQRIAAQDDAGIYLTAAERSTGQLFRKLTEKGYHEDVARESVSWAVRNGYVDDRRFSSLIIRSKTLGRAGMRRELVRKGVAAEVITEVLEDYADSDRADELISTVRKRYGSLQDREKARRRAAGWLSRRGFSSEVIFRVLREAL